MSFRRLANRFMEADSQTPIQDEIDREAVALLMSQQVCFVLTSDGRDVHADLTLISAQFVRRANPNISIVVLCDEESAGCFTRTQNPLIAHIDGLVAVPTPPGSPGFRNRFVKTQMRRHLKGPFLYLDADTLVLKSLDEIFSCNSSVAAVSNHNGPANPCQIFDEELAVFYRMGWPIPKNYYINGGVLYLSDKDESHSFCEIWHAKWRAASKLTGTHFDQPSLNSALNESSPDFLLLNERYNAQVNICPGSARGAAIWHIYKSDPEPYPRNVIETCLLAVRKTGLLADGLIDSVCQRSHPWHINNLIDLIAVRAIRHRRSLPGHSLYRLWLAREYSRLLECVCSRIRAMFGHARTRTIGNLGGIGKP